MLLIYTENKSYFLRTGVKVVILIWDHDKREASGMTPSTDTIDYFTSKNIPCIANQRIAVDRNERNEIKHCHSQRFSVMDEPMSNENEVNVGRFKFCGPIS